MSIYLGHKNPTDNTEQLLLDHLHGVSTLASLFASEFGESDAGKIVGLYHDIGKYSEQFQNYIRHETHEKVDHSTAGALEVRHLLIALCIAGHHSGIPNLGIKGIPDSFWARMSKKLPDYSVYKSELPAPSSQIKSRLLTEILSSKNFFSAMFYTRMIFSCLVDADFLDTENFMYKGNTGRGSYPSIEELKIQFDDYIGKTFLNKNHVCYNTPINVRRRAILEECIAKGETSTKKLLRLTVPTGGGKTIASMAFALHNAVKNGKRRIIYVIPYTSIIEQTAKIFSNIFGAENVLEHHMNAEYNNSDAGAENKNYLATENWAAPIIVTTNVQFFESLFSNRTSKCRKLHNIANSVVIFDEAQLIPIDFLRPCSTAIEELTLRYRCTSVLCTATQPALENIFNVSNIPEICSNVEDNYNYFRRVTIKVCELEMDLEDLASQLLQYRQILCIVNTKKIARRLFEGLKNEKNVFHLSTNLCPAHRSIVMKEIKRCLTDGKNCRVISTSLVEAGVDLDFPCVYREITGLDSIIQAAGRCNREGRHSKVQSLVYVFSLKNSTQRGFQSRRVSASKIVLEKYASELDSPTAIRGYFGCLYQWSQMDKKQILSRSNKTMPFKDIAADFSLIEEHTKPVFIPFDSEAKKIAARLRNDEISRTLLRQAGKYIVNVYYGSPVSPYEKFLAARKIEALDNALAILIDESAYDASTGLNQNFD